MTIRIVNMDGAVVVVDFRASVDDDESQPGGAKCPPNCHSAELDVPTV